MNRLCSFSFDLFFHFILLPSNVRVGLVSLEHLYFTFLDLFFSVSTIYPGQWHCVDTNIFSFLSPSPRTNYESMLFNAFYFLFLLLLFPDFLLFSFLQCT